METRTSETIKRGDIFYADLSPVIGSEQGGIRPVLIIQNDIGNKYSPTVIAAAITSRMGKAKLPTHIDVYAARAGLSRDSVVLLEQLRTCDLLVIDDLGAERTTEFVVEQLVILLEESRNLLYLKQLRSIILRQ